MLFSLTMGHVVAALRRIGKVVLGEMVYFNVLLSNINWFSEFQKNKYCTSSE
jgi:hypothetical protein